MRHIIIMKLKKLLFIVFLAMLCAGGALAASRVRHAIIGSIETVDRTTKTVAVRTADGTVETIKWTGKTTVHGLKDGARVSDFAGREGSHVVAHYTVDGSKKTARTFEYLGRKTPKVIEGTIKVAGKGAKTVVVKTGDGAEETFDLSKYAVIDTGKGIRDASSFTTKETVDGTKVTVHYTEEGSRKVAHFFKHL